LTPFWAGSLASLLAGLATVIGAIPVLTVANPTDRQQNLFLGFAAGVMIAAAFFSLIIPGLEQAQQLGATRAQAAAIVVAAVLLGSAGLGGINKYLPSLERLGLQIIGEDAARTRRIWLFVAAITLHNFPEGLAVGVSFGGGDFAAGTTTAFGIGLQNIPEGLAVAGAVASLGYSRTAATMAALLSGLVEPVAGLVGAGAVTYSAALLPAGLGFAAGAMIYIVASEIIPDVYRRRNGEWAMIGFMTGLSLMMFLDISLG